MRKLTKVKAARKDTIEAYACICSCGCGDCPGCGCAAGVVLHENQQAYAFSETYSPASQSGKSGGYIK